MQCNIDAKGKSVRLVSGMVVTLIGLVLLALMVLDVLQGWWAWGLAAALIALGGFQIFEGRSGWCVVRALGFKTPV